MLGRRPWYRQPGVSTSQAKQLVCRDQRAARPGFLPKEEEADYCRGSVQEGSW